MIPEPAIDFSQVGPVQRGPAHEPNRPIPAGLRSDAEAKLLATMKAEFPDARVVGTVSRAADQDGYDGGWVARDDSGREACGATAEEARGSLEELQLTP